MAKPLFEINPKIDQAAYAQSFKRQKRVQIGDFLTEETAREILGILQKHTPWGLSWKAGNNEPQALRHHDMRSLSQQDRAAMDKALAQSMACDEYAFIYASYPMVPAYQQKWDEGGVFDLLLEYINDQPFLDLMRNVTGITELKKADAQATFFAPGHFLAAHNDSHVAEGWRIAYVMNFTAAKWRPEWGGQLNFLDQQGNIEAGYLPRFNSINLFAVPQQHFVSQVSHFAPLGRFAHTGWLRDM